LYRFAEASYGPQDLIALYPLALLHSTEKIMEPLSTQLTIKKRQGRNQYYDEILAEGVLPLRMLLIPAGTFLMGSPEGELEQQDDEGPQHDVNVPQFFMAKHPVTQAQWRVVAAMPQVKQVLEPDPSSLEGDLRPVEQVSWHDAVEFCDRLTQHTNRQYRLPSEAEWEYACRAGTTTPFHFGETLSTDYANYNGADEEYGAYGPGRLGEYRGETTPVDHFEGANTYGLCDMHGNVWEWCLDHWHRNYDGAPPDGSAWIEGGDSSYRVLRGGSWCLNPRNCRSAFRNNYFPVSRLNYYGFRVCCTALRKQATVPRT
jgi:formylglycine-generating enzyme required for sulfatase activity